MPPTPPSEKNQLYAWIEALLVQHHVDLIRLWRRLPNDEVAVLAMPAEQVITVPPECEECSEGFSECWELTVAGVTDDQCVGCAPYNGTFTIKHIAGCSYETDFLSAVPKNLQPPGFPPFCEPTGWRWRLAFDIISIGTDGFWHLWVSGNGVNAAYELSPEDFDCNGPNVFDLIPASVNDACQGFPPTLTITPTTCP